MLTLVATTVFPPDTFTCWTVIRGSFPVCMFLSAKKPCWKTLISREAAFVSRTASTVFSSLIPRCSNFSTASCANVS